jgi:ParB/RepB/Spo0J family partition protein
MHKENLKIEYVSIESLVVNEKNPRKWNEDQKKNLTESIKRFGNVDPIIVNAHPERKNTVVGGHFRLEVCKELGYKNMPVIFVNLTKEKEEELNLRLNKNQGEFDLDLLAEFDESLLNDIGFSSEEIDEIFPAEVNEEQFDLQKELDKLDIKVKAQKGDIYDLDGSRIMIGDSTIEADMLRLMGENKAKQNEK